MSYIKATYRRQGGKKYGPYLEERESFRMGHQVVTKHIRYIGKGSAGSSSVVSDVRGKSSVDVIKELGYYVTYGDVPDKVKEDINRGIEDIMEVALNLGLPVPKLLTVQVISKAQMDKIYEGTDIKAAGSFDTRAEVVSLANLPNQYYNMRNVVVHELGHAMMKAMRPDTFTDLNLAMHFKEGFYSQSPSAHPEQMKEFNKIAGRLSEYAKTNLHEFFAEYVEQVGKNAQLSKEWGMPVPVDKKVDKYARYLISQLRQGEFDLGKLLPQVKG